MKIADKIDNSSSTEIFQSYVASLPNVVRAKRETTWLDEAVKEGDGEDERETTWLDEGGNK